MWIRMLLLRLESWGLCEEKALGEKGSAKSTFQRAKGDTETITKKDTNANIAVYRVKAISCIALLFSVLEGGCACRVVLTLDRT